MRRLSASVDLATPADALWRSVCRLEGVNYELGPILRMTAPRGLREASIDEVVVGEPVGRSWLLLGGLVPVDYDDLRIVELEPPRRFLERSTMLTMTVWEHERTIEPRGDGSVLTDGLGFQLRPGLRALPGVERLAATIVAALFRHRHRRLAKLHGHPLSNRGETTHR
jgi:ligand-binding SRPBCC domain-containing protein